MKLTESTVLEKPVFEEKTYQLSEEKVEGFVEGTEALRQAICKILMTEKYEHLIYSFRYGISWKELVGKEQPYVRAEMRRMIQEALLQDDRIQEVDGFSFVFEGDRCICTFEVLSIYGTMKIKKEVKTEI